MMRGFLRFLGTCGMVFGVMIARAMACSCHDGTADEFVASGNPIVLATVSEVHTPGGCSGGTDLTATIIVEEVISGSFELGETQVTTSESEASCGLSLSAGATWVLQINGDGSVGMCEASRSVSGSQDAWVAELRAAAE